MAIFVGTPIQQWQYQRGGIVTYDPNIYCLFAIPVRGFIQLKELCLV